MHDELLSNLIVFGVKTKILSLVFL